MLINHPGQEPHIAEDAYLKSMRRKQFYFKIMMLLSVLMVAIAWLNMRLQFAPNHDEQTFSSYCGIAGGLFAVSLVKLWMYRRILRSETLYKEQKRQRTDERNISICHKAMQAAATTVVIGSYAAMLIGGLFNVLIFWCFWLVIMLYLFAYCIFTTYYQGKM